MVPTFGKLRVGSFAKDAKDGAAPPFVVEIPCEAVGCVVGQEVLRLREALASPMSRFAEDDRVAVVRRGESCRLPTDSRFLIRLRRVRNDTIVE